MISIEEIKSLLPLLQILSQVGLALIIFVIWYFTFKSLTQFLKDSNEVTAEAFKKHTTLSESLIQLLKDEQEYKTLLTGILTRFEGKLNTFAQCPILIGKKINIEVIKDDNR